MTIPLLPKGTWTPQAAAGLHSLSDQEYQHNLCENYYDASPFGTPSPLAQGLVFRYQIDRFLQDNQEDQESRFEDAYKTWELFTKAIYLGCVDFEDLELDALGDLGRIVRTELPRDFPLRLLLFRGRVIGFTFPDIGFVPSVRLGAEVLFELQQEVRERTVDTAVDYFVAWVHSHDDLELGSLRFYALLYEMARRWNPEGPTQLPVEAEKLFGKTARLWLSDADLAGGIARPWMPVYVGTPIVCDRKPCYYDNFTSDYMEISSPDDLRCPTCEIQKEWLSDYEEWIRFSKEKGCFLIYAFDDSGIHQDAYRKNVRLEEDGAVVTTSRMTIRVNGLVLRERYLKCTRLTFFRDRDQVIRPSLPVRGEYFGVVELSRDRRPVFDKASGDYLVFLQVQGWDDEVVLRYKKDEVQQEEALLLTWPNFRVEGWNVYYYLLEAPPHLAKAGISLRALDRRGTPNLLKGSRGQLNHPADAFEIVFTSKAPQGGTKMTGQAGIFTLQPYSMHRGESAVTLSLDYGTSSTSAWYRMGDGEPQLVRFQDFTEVLIGNQVLSDRVLDHAYWLPTFRLDDERTAERFFQAQLEAENEEPVDAGALIERLNYFLPSELVIEHPVSAQQLDRPLAGFRICHAYASKPDGEVRYETKTLDPSGDAEGRFSYQQAVRRYLEQFLVLALASIVSREERAGFLKVRASFPRAFSSDKLGIFLSTLDDALRDVERLTGFNTSSRLYIDEARASAYSARMPEGMTLVMDMGGGTTDIGVFEWKKGELESVFAESLLYGGNAFLRLLSSDQDKDLFPKPSVPVGNGQRMLWLLREIRLRGWDKMVQGQYRGNLASRYTMLDLLLRFYAPLAHFVGRLFEALPLHRGEEGRDYRKEPVNYYLVGNGWTLADAMEPPDSGYRPGHHEVLRYLLEKEGFTQLTPAKEPSFDSRNRRWPGPKAAVGFGAISADDRHFYRDIPEATGDGFGTHSITGFGYRYTDGSSNGASVDWHQEVPHPIPDRKQMPVVADLDLPEAWDFIDYEKGSEAQALQSVLSRDIRGEDNPRMTRSVMTRFLEKIYLAQLSRARRT